MFRAIISPIIRSTRLCLQLVVQSTGDAACRQSTAPDDGRNYRPKHVELIVIINKNLLLLHLVGCLYYYKNITLTLVRLLVLLCELLINARTRVILKS